MNRSSHTFDALYRLDDSTAATYRYDALSRRISKTVGGTETRFVSFGSRVLEETNGSNTLQGNYVYGGYIDEVINMKRGSSQYYYHGDDQHNVMALSDPSGALVQEYDYDDFGKQTETVSVTDNPYLFNGRRLDTESELYYYRTRYMDPNQGRFTTRDSIGIWGDFSNIGNGYTYVGNNPFTFIDPFGLDTLVIHTTLPDYLNHDKIEFNDGFRTHCVCKIWSPSTGHTWIEYIYDDGTRETYGNWPDNSSEKWPEHFSRVVNDPEKSDLRVNVEYRYPPYNNQNKRTSRYYDLSDEEERKFKELKDEWLNKNNVYSLWQKNCVNWALEVMNEVLNDNYDGIGPESYLDGFIYGMFNYMAPDEVYENFEPIRSPWGIHYDIQERERRDPSSRDNPTSIRQLSPNGVSGVW